MVAFYSCQSDKDINEELDPIVIIPTPEPEATDEVLDDDLSCKTEFRNNSRTKDIPNPVNVGTMDDRTCYADYTESTIYGKVWGVYNITAGSNHKDAANTLQPRMERALPVATKTTVGTYVKFTGVVRILEAGKTDRDSSDGTYIMQAKGKHTGGGGSADPAICLFLAKPVYGIDGNGNRTQISFNIFREQIKYRGGSGSGRDVVFLTNIRKNVATTIELEVGFRANPNDASKKIHYADAVIGGEAFNWNIPEPDRGTESKIRYGAYRVKGGRGQIRWADTTTERVQK